MRLVILCLFLLFAATVFAEERHERLTMAEGEHYELCSLRAPGDMIDYQFTSSDTVNFNIHYHKQGKTVYPVNQKNIKAGEGSYTVDTAIGHCLMWTNRNPWEVDLDINVSYN